MLHAQGSITIRRRPKDGNPGADAVRYWLVPSVSQVKKTDDGKYHPTSVTCEKRKQTGNSSPIVTSEGTLKYQIGYTDNSTSNLTNYSSAITIPANCQWIKFVLYVNNIDVATETVPVVADGESVFILDLDNEMQGIPCNSSGTPTITGTLASTNSTVYKGASVDTGWTFSKQDSGCTSSINSSNGKVDVSAISADKASVTITAKKGTQTLSAVMSLYKVKAGNDGNSPVIYSIEASVSAISRNASDTLSPTSITAYKNKTVGTATTRTTEKTLKYKREGQDSTEITLSDTGGTITNISASCTAILLKLYDTDGATLLDSERIPIVKDGKDGKEGNPGPQGLQGCIFRRSKFATGFEYHNDSALTDTGLRYIDLVYLMTDNTIYASHAKWFRCKKTHSSTESNAPQLTNNGTESWLEFWEPLNTMVPIYTPLLLADDAIITLMQSNQILIENDEGVITAGMSGSLAGKKIRIWAGSTTPDNAPFRVDVDGNLVATKADISGTINATSGKIAGFNISGSALTNGPDFSNDACIIFRNDTHKTFAGIGGNVLPATTGNRAVARFENEDSNNFWGLGRNIAMLLSAKNADINHAFLGTGNGNLDGWISGYHYSKYTINSSNTIYDGFLKISKNNKWIVYATGSSSGITLPTLSQVRKALGIGTSTPFCIEFIVVADLNSQNGFNIYGRCKKEVTVNGAKQTPYFTGEYPTMTHWNNGRYDNLEMGAGDAVTFLLVYDPNKTGVLDKSYTLMYTARIINRQN